MGAVKVVQNYRDLRVWQAAMDLVEACYELTKSMPDSEKYGLTKQIHRSAVSIPSNIAEGSGRLTIGQYLQFVAIANGSLRELETQLLIAVRLRFLPPLRRRMCSNSATALGRCSPDSANP